VGLRGGPDAVKRIKFLPCQESNPGHPACNLVTVVTELLWLIVI